MSITNTVIYAWDYDNHIVSEVLSITTPSIITSNRPRTINASDISLYEDSVRYTIYDDQGNILSLDDIKKIMTIATNKKKD